MHSSNQAEQTRI